MKNYFESIMMFLIIICVGVLVFLSLNWYQETLELKLQNKGLLEYIDRTNGVK